MQREKTGIPAVDDDPVIQLLLSGAAATLYEAEEMYLDASLPQVIELLRSPLSEEELSEHPLLALMLSHGSRGREDTLP
jgi:hypothetical protein